MNEKAAHASASNLVRRGFDWSGTTPRLPYLLVTIAGMGLTSMIPFTRNFSGENTALLVVLSMVIPIWLGHTRRRLRDVGWSGWLMWVAFLPIIGLGLTILLAFKPGGNLLDPAENRYSRLGFGAALLLSVWILSRAFWAPYWIPSGSMKPTLLVGDFLAVVPLSVPQRGDVLTVRLRDSNSEFIMRLIGLPGDTIEMRGGVIVLNDTPVEQLETGVFREGFAPQGSMPSRPRCSNENTTDAFCEKTELTETLPNGRSYSILNITDQRTDTTAPITLGENDYFLLGDNRDNSNDSRMPFENGGVGVVPRENLNGRVTRVLFSSAGTRLLHVWTWRADRMFTRVE
ncbi:MAG: signal peptidase I [Roseovarius sp.]